jgi:hypothetical protein
MNAMVRTVAVGCTLVGAVLGPARAADAAPERHVPVRGTIMICSADDTGVYADGPSVREDDLAAFTKSGECTNWKPVLPGNYEIGFAMHTAWPGSLSVECLVRRNKQHVFYEHLNREGHVYTTVAPGELTRIDLRIAHG